MHEGVTAFLTEFANTFPGGDALDIGGRNINGHGRGVWPHLRWDVMDIRSDDGVTIVADATRYLYALDESFDLIICTETFEHVAEWPAIVRNAFAWLRPGGGFVATCAGPGFPEHSAYDGMPRLLDGEDYRNVSASELADVMRLVGFDVLDARQAGQFTYAAAVKPEVENG